MKTIIVQVAQLAVTNGQFQFWLWIMANIAHISGNYDQPGLALT